MGGVALEQDADRPGSANLGDNRWTGAAPAGACGEEAAAVAALLGADRGGAQHRRDGSHRSSPSASASTSSSSDSGDW